jgi:hypothetical protein
MTLNTAQIELLRSAIGEYEFPKVYYRFDVPGEVQAPEMLQVEKYIGELLRSPDPERTKYGLANVLYWGHAKAGYRGRRVKRFLEAVSGHQIEAFQNCVSGSDTPSPRAIFRIRMPEFRYLSFISKVLMFLSPNSHCVLDRQIAQLRPEDARRSLNGLTVQPTYIPVTQHNETIYAQWRAECLDISTRYFAGTYRPVDIERGFFALIQRDELDLARQIYLAA